MSEIPNDLIAQAKDKLKTINWMHIILILGIIGFVIYLVWLFFKRKKETKK